MYEFQKCSEVNRNKNLIKGCIGNDDECAVDPPCASKTELKKWLNGKKLTFKVVDNEANLGHD